MKTNLTRRNFLQGAAVAGSAMALAGCTSSTDDEGSSGSAAATTSTSAFAVPDASSYPIDPDGDDVEALWTSETLRKDSWIKVTNPDGGATLGVMDEARII